MKGFTRLLRSWRQRRMEFSRQRSVNTFKIYSKKARYVKAKSRFFETKGEKERKAMSLEEMLAKG
jgi:hypothetical protein